jgi:hypothetical protein
MKVDCNKITTRGFKLYDKFDKRMINTPADYNLFLSGNGNIIDMQHYNLYINNRYIRLDSTGLPDKNGKEIYDGDKVSEYIEDKEGNYTKISVVEYVDGNYMYDGDFLSLGHNFVEVIGNVYENPD